MSQRKHSSFRGKARWFAEQGRKKARRRALRPPENLEARLAPGTLLAVPPGIDSVAGKLGDSAAVSASLAQAAQLTTAKKQTKVKTNAVDDNPRVNSSVSDAAFAALEAQAAEKLQSLLLRKASPARPIDVPAPGNANATAAGPAVESQPTTLKVQFASVTDPRPIKSNGSDTSTPTQPSAPATAPISTPPTSSGGGGSGANASGPPASGPQAAAALAAAKPAPTSAPAAPAAPPAAAPAKLPPAALQPPVNTTPPPANEAKQPPAASGSAAPESPTSKPATQPTTPASPAVKTPTSAPTKATNPPPAKAATQTTTESTKTEPTKVSKSQVRKSTTVETPTPAPKPTTPAPVLSTPKPATTPPAVNTKPTTTPIPSPSVSPVSNGVQLTTAEVQNLLDIASAATSRTDAIIAIVDRNGRILGVRVESGINMDQETLIFAIDGAVAKARTAAFFANDEGPLTSRTVRFISQSTITQREVESNPNIPDKSSTERGPGFVAPIGVGGHFPPGVMFTPHVDLFAIEHTNRDGIIHPGKDLIRGTPDDVDLVTRFGADFAMEKEILAPESYGKVSGLMPNAQSRGIATLPGGIPLIDKATSTLVGGVGVFFPGPDGYATFEQNFQHADARRAAGLKPQDTNDRLNAPLVLEAEFTALVVASSGRFGLPPANKARIDLVGITLETVGPHPHGVATVQAAGRRAGPGVVNGTNQPVTTSGDKFLAGKDVPDGWLVEPRASATMTADEVRQIIERGIVEADKTRAAIRAIGNKTEMVLSVTDLNGEVLGLYRMPDATFFSIDVAVAKARNVAYYADAADLQPVDQVDANFDGVPEVPAGVAFTNRTFRYLATSFFPTGVDGAGSGPFSTLNDTGINPKTAENVGPPLPQGSYNSILAYDAFNPGSNFHELEDANVISGNQNGIVFFPGSTPLYKNGILVGGFGVSGDGVDQDDVVTFGGGGQFIPGPSSPIVRSDEIFVRGVRLPYQKFNRNPRG